MGSHFNVSWFWTKKDYENLERILTSFEKPMYHICSGVSAIGDIRLDRTCINEHSDRRAWLQGSCNVLGDMIHLPFKDGIAGSVVCDPPYDYNFTDNRLINELIRISKPRAKILFISPWIPKSPIIQLKEHELWLVGKKKPYYKIASTFFKANGQLGDYV